jgi:uncharacterized protein (DUF4415 family)
MKKKNISNTYPDDLDECPELGDDFFDNATLRVNMAPVERKQRISIMLDARVISFFKDKAGARGYQTMINEALKKEIERDDLENRLRKIIREELGKSRSAS